MKLNPAMLDSYDKSYLASLVQTDVSDTQYSSRDDVRYHVLDAISGWVFCDEKAAPLGFIITQNKKIHTVYTFSTSPHPDELFVSMLRHCNLPFMYVENYNVGMRSLFEEGRRRANRLKFD